MAARSPKGSSPWLPPVEVGTVFALGLNYADHAKGAGLQGRPETPWSSQGAQRHHRPLPSVSRLADATFHALRVRTGGGDRQDRLPDRQGRRQRSTWPVTAWPTTTPSATTWKNYYRPNLRVKNRDACIAAGPWLVTRDEIADPMKLALTTRVNGKTHQQAPPPT